MIVYSFAWRTYGHSPCNIRLALAAIRMIAAEAQPVLIVAQRSSARILQNLTISCEVIEKRLGYEGSEEVTRQAAEHFRRFGITEVIPVAQPCLQLTKCVGLVQAAGFTTPSMFTLVRQIGWIGFDPQSVQPATRDPFRLIYYTAKQILFGYRPPVEQSEP